MSAFTGRPEEPRISCTLCPHVNPPMLCPVMAIGAMSGISPETTAAFRADREETMSMVVPPDFKGVVVDSDDKDGRGHDRGHDEGLSTKDAIAASLNSILADVGENTVQTVGLEKDNLTATLTAEGRLAVAVQAVGAAGALASEKIGTAAVLAMKDAKESINDRLSDKFADLNTQVALGAAAGQNSTSNSRVEILNAVNLTNLNLQGFVRDGFSASALAASETSARILQKQADTDAKMASACCELRSELLVESNKVQTMILAQSNIQQALALAIENRGTLSALSAAQAKISQLETVASIMSQMGNRGGYGGNGGGNWGGGPGGPGGHS